MHGETSVAHDPAQRIGIDRILTRDGENPDAVGHDNVLALSGNSKSRLLERPHRIQVIDAWDLGQSYSETSISRTSSFRNSASTTAR